MRKFLIATWVALLSTVTLQAQLKVAVVSDIHVMVPELVEQDGAAFQDYVAHDRKLLMESVALAEAAVDELLAGRPDAVLVTGDLTKDGERVSHEYVAGQLLARLRRAGIPVYVVPGNHDVNNPHARIYRGDEAPRTATVSREEFAALYDDYGYGTALARDTASLSYVVQLNDSVRLLAVDACRYDENDFEANECVVGGRIRPRTLDFIEEQARQMAVRRTRITGEGAPTVTAYAFDERLLEDGSLRVKLFEGPGKEWALFVMANRTEGKPHGYDIVVGPVTDDGVAFQLERYVRRMITLDVLVEELTCRRLNRQYYFGSELSISKLKRL